MFALSSEDFGGKVLDCAAGPASFNAEATARGHEVVSCDPLYRHTAEQIQARIDATHATVVANARVARDEFVWRDIRSPEHLGEVRLEAMSRFLADFPLGVKEGRYLARALPRLGFPDGDFDLALCSHFLFTYSGLLSLDFHAASIEEMCRVAGEVRVFPLLKAYGGTSPHLEPLLNGLRERGYRVEIRKVPYEFQRGGDEMLAVVR